jgi:type VI secretion system protein ImpJ
MSSDPAVHWHEGMFLRTQHFQLAERHSTTRLARSVKWTRPFAWGLFRFLWDWDPHAAGHTLLVNELQARLETGVVVSVPDDCPPLKLNLAGHLAHEADVTVVLGVPELQPRAANVSEERNVRATRYVQTSRELADENDPENLETVLVRRLNLSLFVGALAPRQSWDLLPLIAFDRPTADGERPKLKTSFVPPLLGIDACPPLKQRLEDLMNYLRDRFRLLTENRTVANLEHNPRLFALSAALQEGHALLKGLLSMGSVAPHTTYLELVRLAGRLAIFDDPPRLAEVPPYKHTELAGSFDALDQAIRDRIELADPQLHGAVPDAGGRLRIPER